MNRRLQIAGVILFAVLFLIGIVIVPGGREDIKFWEVIAVLATAGILIWHFPKIVDSSERR